MQARRQAPQQTTRSRLQERQEQGESLSTAQTCPEGCVSAQSITPFCPTVAEGHASGKKMALEARCGAMELEVDELEKSWVLMNGKIEAVIKRLPKRPGINGDQVSARILAAVRCMVIEFFALGGKTVSRSLSAVAGSSPIFSPTSAGTLCLSKHY